MPLEGIPWPAVGVGTMGWLIAFYFMHRVISGKLIPIDQHVRQVERAEHDSSEWRTEGRIKDQQIAVMGEQLGIVRELAKTVSAIMSAMQGRRERYDDGDHDQVGGP